MFALGLLTVALSTFQPEAGPCAGDPPPEPTDPALSLSYLEVAQEERAAGHARTAAVAFARALSLDPALAPARAGLSTVCAAERDEAARQTRVAAERAFAAGVERFHAGDDRGALAAMERAASLPDLRAPASLYRALVAARAEDWAGTRQALAVASHDPALAEGVAALARVAARQGRLVLQAGTEVGYDDNAELLPDTPPTGSTRQKRGDGRFTLSAGALARPVRGLDLRFEEAVSYRDQLEVDALDLLGASTDASLRGPLTPGVRARAGAGLDYLVLGGASYLVAPRAELQAAWSPLPSLWASAGYRLRWRDYRAPALAGFTGAWHEGALGFGGQLGGWLVGEVGYRLVREGARDPVWAATAQGPLIDLALRPLAWIQVLAHAGLKHRSFAGVDPNVGFRRTDDEVSAELRVEADVADHVTCQVAAATLWNTSSVVDFEFSRLSVLGGCSLIVGLL